MGCTPAKPSQRWVKKAMHATAFGIKSNIWKPVGVHDVVQEVGERGAEPAGEVINKKGIPIGAGLGESSRDDACGRVPRRLPPP